MSPPSQDSGRGSKTPIEWCRRALPVGDKDVDKISTFAGVGMPNIGPGTVPVKPLTVIVKTPPPTRERAYAELQRPGAWLGVHYGHAPMAVVTGRTATKVRIASSLSFATPFLPVASRAKLLRRAFARPGQHLVITLGQGGSRSRPGVASLRLPTRAGATMRRTIELREGNDVLAPVNLRHVGVVAATAARGHLPRAPSAGRVMNPPSRFRCTRPHMALAIYINHDEEVAS